MASESLYLSRAPHSLLRERLLQTVQITYTCMRFISAGDLENIITKACVEKELLVQGLNACTPYVLERARKIFVILVLIRMLHRLPNFVENGVDDKSLPLVGTVFELAKRPENSSPSSWLNLDEIRDFLEMQWIVLAPVFSQGSHLELADEMILPFISARQINAGAFGTVQKIKIHRDHDNLDNASSSTSPKVNNP